MHMARDGTIDPELKKGNTLSIEGWIWDTTGLPDPESIDAIGKSGWKSGDVIVKISDLEKLGFVSVNKPSECESCEGRTMEDPFKCSVAFEIKQLIGRHSGMDGKTNQMEIKVTRCHHKDRVNKDAAWKKKVIKDATKETENK